MEKARRGEHVLLRRRSRTFALTLLELLIVIAIAAVLASLLLPVLSRSKVQAHIIYCKSNVRQIFLGLQMYVQDSGVYPKYEWDAHWPKKLEPYTGHTWTNKLYRCPSFKGITVARPGIPGSANLLGSYGYNDYPSWGDWYNPHPYTGLGVYPENLLSLPRWLREDEVKVPSDMIALGDGNYSPFNNRSGYLPLPQQYVVAGQGSLNKWQCLFLSFSPDLQAEALKLVRRRHLGKYNVAFCDGHIELIAHEKLYQTNEVALRRWDRDNVPRR